MPTRRICSAMIILIIGSLFIFGLVHSQPEVSAQGQSETPKVVVLLPDDDGFDDFEDLTESTTGLSGSEWVSEFGKQTKFGDATSGNGLNGILYVDALRMTQLFEGKAKFLFYGLFTFPAQYPVNPSTSEVEYGVSVFLTQNEMVIVLVDLDNDGKLAAFIIVPRVGNGSPALPFVNLDAFLSVFLILETLPNLDTISTPTVPLPIATSSSTLACPTGLTKVRDLNITLSSVQSITLVKDAAGENLFEIAVAPPNKITIRSFNDTQRVDVIYSAEGTTHLIFLAGPSTQEVELTADKKFVLTASSGDKQSCVLATPSASGDNLKITGELQAK